MRNSLFFSSLTATGFFLASLPAFAGIQITGTRVIYPGDARSVTVQVANRDTAPRLIKAWVDGAEDVGEPARSDVPFVITPPLSRVEGGEGQALRLARVSAIGPADRESVYWLNVLDVPPNLSAPGKNMLQFAVRTRIKIFYRPPGLAGSADKAAADMCWTRIDGQGVEYLQVNNRSAFHVSIADIDVPGYTKIEGKMISPMSQQRFELGTKSRFDATDGGVIRTISDHGAIITTSFVIDSAC